MALIVQRHADEHGEMNTIHGTGVALYNLFSIWLFERFTNARFLIEILSGYKNSSFKFMIFSL